MDDGAAAAAASSTSKEMIDGRDLWQFLERAKGWRFTGKGYDVRGPSKDSTVMKEAEVRYENHGEM